MYISPVQSLSAPQFAGGQPLKLESDKLVDFLVAKGFQPVKDEGHVVTYGNDGTQDFSRKPGVRVFFNNNGGKKKPRLQARSELQAAMRTLRQHYDIDLRHELKIQVIK